MKTILVVEDNKDIRDEICGMFKMVDFNILEASNGLEGYMTAIDKIPDIIISDIRMPVFDGYKMYEELKKNILTDSIPIIFLSALTTDQDIRKGMNIGVDDYLKKPVSPDDLIKAINTKLEKYAKNDEKYENLKIDLTNILHHELNTPLNGIIGFSDFLKERLFDMSKEDMKEIIDNLYNSGIRLHKLVNKYLNYADIKMVLSDQNELKQLRKVQFLNTYDVIYDVISNKVPLERQEDLILDIDFVKIKIKKNYFELMIEEIIENAVKFSNTGDKISVISKANNERYLLNVKNEGKGMKQEQIKSIQDFKQFKKKLHAQQGSGIGLSIVKMITQMYGGNFEVKSITEKTLSVLISFKSGFNIF